MSERKLLYGYDAEVRDWVSSRCALVHFGFDAQSRAIGVLLNNELVAGFVYSDYQPNFRTIEMSIAADSSKWASKRVIYELLAYPFIGCDCQRITVTTAETNHKALRLATGVGFVQEAVVERAYGKNENAVLLRLFKEEWQAGKYGMRK